LTLTVRVLADWSRLTPPLAVPQTGRAHEGTAVTWLPRTLASAVKVSLPAVMSAAETKSPALSAGPPVTARVPAAGRVVILTASREFAGLSLASVKPKSAVAIFYDVSAYHLDLHSFPTRRSSDLLTLTVRVLADWSRLTPPLAVP